MHTLNSRLYSYGCLDLFYAGFLVLNLDWLAILSTEVLTFSVAAGVVRLCFLFENLKPAPMTK